MRRDMDLIRQILLAIDGRLGVLPPRLAVAGHSEAKVEHHVGLMTEAGLLLVLPDGVGWLTWKGHELLDSVRCDAVWQHAKGRLAKLGDVPLPVWEAALHRAALDLIGL
jgi:hypothetical protein